ncbi:spore gernimation protein KC [Paenibacillus sp. 32O-W]|uniref:GerAB/ArcD/ProY family transporter n=1 Tax=Paenibacillus sp. 32O-W TaxID=1695218 RepID=UPI0007201E5D|nr:endospore germination permease [Paenibacillus sp. 32O-W]ALS28678.1 spore gernimation protein KC [Paenibacillus sp. 32O-W]
MNSGMISRWQFFLLTINYILGTLFFVLIQVLIREGGQDAWLMPWWGGAVGILIALLWIYLYRLHTGKSLVQIALASLGRAFGTIVGVLYFLYFCILAGWVLRNLSDFMNGTIMQETPKSVFHVMFLLVACYTVSNGIETIARLNQVLTPFLFFSFWFVMLLATVNWDWSRFEPVFLTENWTRIVEFHSFLGFPYMESIVLMMVFPLVNKSAGRSFVWGIVFASLSLSLILFMIVGLLGIGRASRLTFPIYSVVKEVLIGEVVMSIHSIISVILLILIFIKLLVLVYAAYESLNQMFMPSTKWPILTALTLFMSAMAGSIYENPIQNGKWNQKYTFVYSAFFVLFIPSLLLAVTWAKKIIRKTYRRLTG